MFCVKVCIGVFFFEQKAAYEMESGRVGAKMCKREMYVLSSIHSPDLLSFQRNYLIKVLLKA